MKAKYPSLSRLLVKIAPRAGAKVFLEPKYGRVGQIVCSNGKIHYFRGNNFDLNPMGSSAIAIDKDYANFFMSKLGYPTIPGKAFYSEKFCKVIKSKDGMGEAYKFAKKLGFPVIVKPNSKSQGKCVFKVNNKLAFYKACLEVFKCDRVVLVQKFIQGNDYRIVVLDGEVISAYQRLPLTVTGNGIDSISELLKKKQLEFKKAGRETKININDIRIKMFLAEDRTKVSAILKKGEKCQLLPNANLSSGGEALDVINDIHKDFKNISVKLTAKMGLRFCGVDLMIDGSIACAPKKYYVIEINSAPGIDNYFAMGKQQQKIVEELYIKVLKAIAKQ